MTQNGRDEDHSDGERGGTRVKGKESAEVSVPLYRAALSLQVRLPDTKKGNREDTD